SSQHSTFSISTTAAVEQEPYQCLRDRPTRDKRVKLDARGAVRFLKRGRVRVEGVQVTLPHQRRLTQPRAFAFEPAQSQPLLEREADLVFIEDAQRDRLVPAVPQSRERA